MIPIGDDRLMNARLPLLNWLLIICNVWVFLYEIKMPEPDFEVFLSQYAVIPSHILQFHNLSSLFTSMFLHGGWLHLLGNMLFLGIFGRNIETVLGHAGYLLFYLFGGIVSALVHVYFNYISDVPTMGASGAISAVMGAYLVMFPRARVRMLIPIFIFFTTIRVSAWIFLGVWILIQLLNGNAAQHGYATADTSVAWFAHIGGFAYGFVMGLIFKGRANRYIIRKA